MTDSGSGFRERPDPPEPVKAAGLRMLAYAGFGGPGDRLRAAALVWPALDTMAIEGDYLLDLQRALQRGDRALAARQFAAINAIRATQFRP